MNYVALLRGINISGKNKMAMSDLKYEFEQLGFSNVVTYINSGNIVFTNSIHDLQQIKQQIEDMIVLRFNLDIPVCVVPQSHLNQIIIDCPNWWISDRDYVTYAIFPIPPITTNTIVREVGDINDEIEMIDFNKDVIYWMTARASFNQAKWSKIASSSMNDKVTIRTINTVFKIQGLLNKISKIT